MNRAEALVVACLAHQNCVKTGNEVWLERHSARIKEYLALLPFPSRLDASEVTAQKLPLTVRVTLGDPEWADATHQVDVDVVVTRDLTGLDLEIRTSIEDHEAEYVAEVLHDALNEPARVSAIFVSFQGTGVERYEFDLELEACAKFREWALENSRAHANLFLERKGDYVCAGSCADGEFFWERWTGFIEEAQWR